MITRKVQALTLAIFCVAGLSFAQQKEQTLSLTLEECILMALRNNLSVAIQVLNPELSEVSVTRAKEKFMPLLGFDYSKRNTNSASFNWLDAAETSINKTDSYSFQVSQAVPTGGSLSITLDNARSDSNRRALTINPSYNSTLRFNFTQPLLKDFGAKMSRREIIIAQNNLEMSEKDLKKTLLDTIYSVEQAYWNLVESIETLNVRRQSLQLSQDLLTKNQRAVEIGTMAPIEILSAQATVATREADILQAEAQVRNSEDTLKALLNISKEDMAAAIIPVDNPSFEERKVDLDQCLLIALRNRPDLESTRIDLENQEINLSFARNQLLPNLSLSAAYWSPGVSGDRIIYAGNNPLSGVIENIVPGGSSDAMKDVFGFKYKNWSLALSLDIPLSNFLSKANYAQAKLNMDQLMLRLKNQEQQITLEIRNAVRSIETNYKRVQAYRVARELAEKNLQAEEEKLRVGLSTNYFVLQYQERLSNARTSELGAIVDYNLSLARLDQVLGVTLDKKNIKVSEFWNKD